MNNLDLALVWLGFFAAIFLGWYFYLQARNKERMALIERDKDVSEIYSKQEFKFRFPWLKLGLMITGIGLGIGIVTIFLIDGLDKIRIGYFDALLIFTSAMFFGGLGLVLGYFLEKPKNK